MDHTRDPWFMVVAEAKLNNILYFVYTLPAICTVQLINTWYQFGLSAGFVDYSENGPYTHRYTEDKKQ